MLLQNMNSLRASYDSCAGYHSDSVSIKMFISYPILWNIYTNKY